MTASCRRVKSSDDIQICLDIRHVVFVEGQNVPQNLEVDGLDSECWHYLIELERKPTATMRVRFVDNVAKLERVAVLAENRGSGYGRNLVAFALEDIKKNTETKTAKVGSQTHAISFYKKIGFEVYGDEFMDAGIPHYNMEMDLTGN